jgi:carboxymethylenebutenolidase
MGMNTHNEAGITSMSQSKYFGRRQFLGASAIAMLALSVRPALAAITPIHTDSDGLVAQQVRIPITGGEIAGYCAYPAKGGNFSVILVAHDVFGVNEQMQDVVRRLAKLGYYAICPDLFSRQGGPGKSTDELDIMRTVVSKVVDAEFVSDLDATVAFAKKSGKADVKKVGITGFGWGGRAAWVYAAHDPKLKAAVSYYGFLQPSRDPKGQSALALASQVKVPALGFYGAKDDYIMEADANAMKSALAGNKKADIVVFPGVKHGFMADDRASYDAKTAADAWDRMTVCFKNNGL